MCIFRILFFSFPSPDRQTTPESPNSPCIGTYCWYDSWGSPCTRSPTKWYVSIQWTSSTGFHDENAAACILPCSSRCCSWGSCCCWSDTEEYITAQSITPSLSQTFGAKCSNSFQWRAAASTCTCNQHWVF